jgi:hypothetical protein
MKAGPCEFRALLTSLFDAFKITYHLNEGGVRVY